MKTVLLFDLGKYTEMRLSVVHIFLGQKRLLPIQKISKHYLKIFFLPNKRTWKTIPFLDQIMGQLLWKICKNAPIWSAYFYGLETILFYLKDLQTLFSRSFLPKNRRWKKCWFNPFGKYANLRLSEVYIF